MARMEPTTTISATSSTTSSRDFGPNPNCAETFASLRLYGDNLLPEEISRWLGVAPSEAAAKGDKKAGPNGMVRSAPTGRWILRSNPEVSSTDLEEHLWWLMDKIERCSLRPGELPGVTRADISCYWLGATGHGGPEFSPETLRRLAERRLFLGLDIYQSEPLLQPE